MPVHRLEPSVANGADRLEDRAVEDVGADRVGRLEAEDDDQDRRHQRAATDAGQAHDQAEAETRERELPGHVAVAPSTMPAPTVSFVASPIRTNAPVRRFSSYGSTSSGSESRSRTTPMSFSSRRSGVATSPRVSTSTRD